MIIGGEQIVSRLHFVPDLELLYVNNPKVACSTIKKALWIGAAPETFVEGMSPHDRAASPFLPTLESLHGQGERIGAATKFTVVRNPYVRILSAYLDKVGRPDRDTEVFHPFARRFALAGDESVSFLRFLELISSEEPSFLDDHFAPQYVTTMYDFCALDFVGRMEELDRVWSFLGTHGIPLSEHRPHATNAAGLLEAHYGPRELEIVSRYFDRDFELFGYSRDPGKLEPVRPVSLPKVQPQVLMSLLAGYCDRDPVRRLHCLEAVARHVPDLELNYCRVESRLVSVGELAAFSRGVLTDHDRSWKMIAAYSQEMLRVGMFHDAFYCVARLKQMLYD